MELTLRQRETIQWLEEISEKSNNEIMLMHIDNFWNVCPVEIDDKNMVVHVGKTNMKVWKSLIKKGYFRKEKSEMNDEGFIYLYNRQK